jgi:hypothetical protein
MRLCLRISGVVLLTLTLAWAGSTKYASIYRNPAAGQIDFSGKRVAAFVVIPDQSMREGREETLAAELRQRGVDCVAGYTVLPGELVRNREKAKEFLKKANIRGAVLMRLLGDEEKTSYSPGTVWYAQPYYPSFWGYWNYGWSTVYMPGYQWTDRVITLETLIYSIDTDALLWAGRSESTNPKDIRKFVKDLVDAAGKEMRHAGLVKK